MRTPLPKPLRKELETAVLAARFVAEEAARAALVQLGVGDPEAPSHLDSDDRKLRNALRARARALGGELASDGTQKSAALREEIAYEHWHRMLFARFLAENGLLGFDDGSGILLPVSLDECAELAPELGFTSPWAFAADCASKMLPGVFREDSLSWRVAFPPDRLRALEEILAAIHPATFQASDALGWVYQFWQTRRKADVNASGIKIGADELPAVTQLFTEPYMVAFLYDNSLGAWYAAPKLKGHLFVTEAEARAAVATPDLPLTYLRLVPACPSREETAPPIPNKPCEWVPAAGSFDDWPANLAEFSLLDPCCGSGHFLVAGLLRLVPIRMEREGISAVEAIDRVLSENIHGLELDRRCVELAAFAVALEAWRYPGTGGVRPLPRLNIACDGVAPAGKMADWLALARTAANDPGSLRESRLVTAMEKMWHFFQDAPTLGSLLEPSLVEETLDSADWYEAAKALRTSSSAAPATEGRETTVAAQGILEAVPLLSRKYTLIITNVPYLGSELMGGTLSSFCAAHYPDAKADLATVFLERCLKFLDYEGCVYSVLPMYWLFLSKYKKFRLSRLKHNHIQILAKLGAGAFEAITGEVVQGLLSGMTRSVPVDSAVLSGVDVSRLPSIEAKAQGLLDSALFRTKQLSQLANPYSAIVLSQVETTDLLSRFARAWQGIVTCDDSKFLFYFWELNSINGQKWKFIQLAPPKSNWYTGKNAVIRWDSGSGDLHLASRAHNFPPLSVLGKSGISIQRMSKLNVALFSGDVFGDAVAPLVVTNKDLLPAVFCYCKSVDFHTNVRKLNQKPNVTPGVLNQVPFNFEHWQAVAAEAYPNGLPKPFTDDPTQWIFHGHPCGSVVWDEEAKRLTIGPDRVDAMVLHVAVARLLGYRWPAECDSAMELAPEMREVMVRNASLDAFTDNDGIVCLPALRGERTAADRLEALLATAYGSGWRADTVLRLLEAEGSGARSLERWLRDKFFLCHVKLFGSRPFIWQIWDGLKDGFSALVLYHKFDRRRLESLAYTYLGDWITRQGADAARGVDGAMERQDAAKALQRKLAAILKGETPFDIFVRWKTLAHQPIGWNPDCDDGVRLNIRPFCEAGVLRESAKQLSIQWDKDRGKDLPSAPWYTTFNGNRINNHHTTLAEKEAARAATRMTD